MSLLLRVFGGRVGGGFAYLCAPGFEEIVEPGGRRGRGAVEGAGDGCVDDGVVDPFQGEGVDEVLEELVGLAEGLGVHVQVFSCRCSTPQKGAESGDP